MFFWINNQYTQHINQKDTFVITVISKQVHDPLRESEELSTKAQDST
jgi:hypothetical protein